jgi:hypothetical protein
MKIFVIDYLVNFLLLLFGGLTINSDDFRNLDGEKNLLVV